ncbi:MAG: endo-1,4-beta-xylanase, partial [Opitutales bacterium]
MRIPNISILLLALLPLSAVAGTELPQGTPMIAGDTICAFKLNVPDGTRDMVKFSTVDVDGPGFSRAWRVETGRDVANIEDVELEGLFGIPVEQGGTAILRVWMRSVASLDETGKGHVFVHVRKNGVDFNSSLIATLSAGSEWQEYLLPFTFIGTYPENGSVIRFRFGYPGQTVEVGGVEVLYYGKTRSVDSLPRSSFTYAGREPDAQWRKDALERIERIRKSPLEIVVVGADGKPVSGAKVTVHQLRSAFHFGSALQLARLTSDTPENAIYREKVLELFNEASPENDLKWPVWLGEWNDLGDFSHAKAIDGLKWLNEHDFYTRGHVLVWPGWKNLPLPVHALHDSGRDDEIMPLIDAHIREMADATRGLLKEWDVLNEPYTNHDLMDMFGPKIMVHWFETAREAMPGVKLYFNDFSNQDQTTDTAHVAHFDDTTKYL